MGAVIRIVLLLIAARMLTEYVDFVVMQDLSDGVYSQDADGLGILVIGTQILITVGVAISLPVAVIGSRFFRSWLSKRSKIVIISISSVFLLLYGILINIGLTGLPSIFHASYQEKWVDGISLLAVVIVMAAIDGSRLLIHCFNLGHSKIARVIHAIPF